VKRCRECGEWFRPARSHFHTCPACFWDEPEPEPVAVRLVPVLDAATIKATLALAHPDMHPPERRERANAVSARLSVALEATRELEAA
jgi:hypothetical protein